MKLRALGLSLILSGCMVGPNYHPPEPCVPETWECAEPLPVAWWQEFQDPMLDRYIGYAAANNFDILTACAHIFDSRAVRMIAASDLFPQVNGYVDALRLAFSKNGPLFNSAISGPGLISQNQPSRFLNIYSALAAATWEIDLFGKIRRGVEAAGASIGSAIEQRHGVLTAVFADVAMNYIDLRSAQHKEALIQENIALLEEETALARRRWEKGLVDRLNLENLEAKLADLKATLPPIQARICQDMYVLSILTGALPETLVEELSPIQPLPAPPDCIACGLRSDLLRRRPDVRQAERELASATANIGVAAASFFPSFSLLGALGLQAVDFRRFFQLDSNTWAIGALSSIPIFQGGNLVGNLRLSEARAAAAAFIYQKTVLTALEEAESALAAYQHDAKSVCHRQAALERYARIDAITAEQYKKGLVDLIQVFESGRQLVGAKENVLDSETTLLIDVVNLYKALGGGWECFP